MAKWTDKKQSFFKVHVHISMEEDIGMNVM